MSEDRKKDRKNECGKLMKNAERRNNKHRKERKEK